MDRITLGSLLDKVLLNHPSLPSESYGAIDVIGDQLRITHSQKGKIKSYKVTLDGEPVEKTIKKEINKIHSDHNYKLIATSFSERELHKKIAPKLWLEEDIVSFLLENSQNKDTIKLEEKLKIVSSGFDRNNIAKISIKKDNEVEISDLVSLSDYKNVSSDNDYSKLLALSNKFKGKRIIFINATPQGGGVALMRHALIRVFKLAGVDAHWYILKPNAFVFNITKDKFHNVLQGVANKNVELTEEDKEKYNLWIKENAIFFSDVFVKADIIVIDDPQPSGLIPYIREINPKAKIVYRSHIQIDTALADKNGTPTHKTWEFIWQNIKQADVFVSHPVPDFIPKDVPRETVVYMPATTDPLDGLNKPLTNQQTDYYINLFNKFLKNENQPPLDLRRPYIIQIARFDPSKGIPDLLESYLKLTEIMKEKGQKPPQLVVTGNGSIDDPDAIPIFNKTMNIINSEEYRNIKHNIKVVRLPHIDQLFNSLLRKSKVALQLSIKEGFEIKVTEALMKGKPVVAYRTGGIPLQIKDGVNGFLIDPGNTREVAERLYALLTNQKLYKKMGWAAENYYDKSLFTIPNAVRWLELATRLTK